MMIFICRIAIELLAIVVIYEDKIPSSKVLKYCFEINSPLGDKIRDLLAVLYLATNSDS